MKVLEKFKTNFNERRDEINQIIVISDFPRMGKTTYANELYTLLKGEGYVFVDGDYIKPSEYKDVPEGCIQISNFEELLAIVTDKCKYVIDTPPLTALVRDVGDEKVKEILDRDDVYVVSVGEKNIFGKWDIKFPSLYIPRTEGVERIKVRKDANIPRILYSIVYDIAESLCQRYCENLDDPYIPDNFVETIIGDSWWELPDGINLKGASLIGHRVLDEEVRTGETFCHGCYVSGNELDYDYEAVYTFSNDDGQMFDCILHINTYVCCVCGDHDDYFPY